MTNKWWYKELEEISKRDKANIKNLEPKKDKLGILGEKHHKVPQWLLKEFLSPQSKNDNVQFLSKIFNSKKNYDNEEFKKKQTDSCWQKPKLRAIADIFCVEDLHHFLDDDKKLIHWEAGFTNIQNSKKYFDEMKENKLTYDSKCKISKFLYSFFVEESILEFKIRKPITLFKVFNNIVD